MTLKRVHDPNAKRARVLDSARELFIERGFAAVSMRDIAQHADVPQSMIHHYFGTKEALWQAVKEAAYDAYLAHQRALLESTSADFAEFVQNSLRSRFLFLQANPQVVRLLLWLQLMQDPYGMETGQATGGALLEGIRHAQAEGLIRRDIEAENILAMALALTTHWFHNRHVIQRLADIPDDDLDAADARYLEAVLTLLTDGLRLQEATPNEEPSIGESNDRHHGR